MCGERDVHVVCAELRHGGAHAVDVRLDEARMVEEHARSRHLGRVRPDRLLRVEEILAVLATARVGAERRREDRERASDAVLGHLPHRVPEVRMPVAVAEVDRQLDAASAQLRLECLDQLTVLGVDRTDAAEQLVVVGDIEQALARDVASARDVLEERQDVVRPFGAAERDEHDRIELVCGPTRDGAVGGLLALFDRRRHRGNRAYLSGDGRPLRCCCRWGRARRRRRSPGGSAAAHPAGRCR